MQEKEGMCFGAWYARIKKSKLRKTLNYSREFAATFCEDAEAKNDASLLAKANTFQRAENETEVVTVGKEIAAKKKEIWGFIK